MDENSEEIKQETSTSTATEEASPATVEPNEASPAEENSQETDPKTNSATQNGIVEAKPAQTKAQILAGKSDLEKAQYSFYKQLNKEKSKHKKEMDELLSRLDKLEHPEKYAPKTRDQYKDDDSFINDLVQDKVNAILQKRMEEEQKALEARSAQEAIEKEYRERADENIKKLYPTPDEEKNFRSVVQDAIERGLGDLLDTDQELSNYILMSPVGPAIMYELASNEESVKRLFEGARTPIDLQFRIRDIERDVISGIKAKEAAAPQNTVTPPQPEKPKPVGKPGVSKEAKKSIWDDDKALIDFMRS